MDAGNIGKIYTENELLEGENKNNFNNYFVSGLESKTSKRELLKLKI
jgi:hypothetical protein